MTSSNPPSTASVADAAGRVVEYVRVSVTDRCDMRCVYCMPAEGMDFVGRKELLTYEEIERIVRALAPFGVRSVRITGGEPLIRRDIVELIRRVAAVPGVDDVAMTTNARLLRKNAAELKAAGLRRVNVSLDSLDPVRFSELTRGEHLEAVLDGIEAAREVGILPIKINAVVVRGENELEVADIVRWSRERDIIPRFIEIMPMGEIGWFNESKLVASAALRERMQREGLELEPIDAGSDADAPGSGPARYWRARDRGVAGSPWSRVGFISPITENFCDACNRIRITPTGSIRACLGWDDSNSLRDIMRNGCSDAELLDVIQASLRLKRAGHEFEADGSGNTATSMSSIGG